jgi:hypothetical protein
MLMSMDGGSSARSAAPQIGKAPISAALRQLKRGELSLDEYFEHRVEDAVAHLKDKVSTEQLEFVREVLRQELHSDPAVREMLRQVLGYEPAPAD